MAPSHVTSHERDDQLAAPTTVEAWHLAAVQTLSEVIDGLGAIVSEPSKDPKVLVELEIGALQQRLVNSWRAFCDAALLRTDRDMSFLFKEPALPVRIRLDAERKAIDITWATPEPQDGAPFLLPGRHALGTTTFAEPSNPFQPVRLTKLPEDTVLLDITDALHAATAAVVEVLRTVCRDLSHHVATLPADVGYQQMSFFVAFYQRTVRLLEQGLGDDEFRLWDRNVVEAASFLDIPKAIVASSTSSNAIRVLAVSLVADLYERAMKNAEMEHGQDYDVLVELVSKRLNQAHTQLSSILDGHNHILLATHGAADVKATLVVIMRTVPVRLPQLALIPSQADVLRDLLDSVPVM